MIAIYLSLFRRFDRRDDRLRFDLKKPTPPGG